MRKKTNKSLIRSPNLFPVVGIGASAGGLDAFKKLLKAIPENSGMAYVLVQHLDPHHKSVLPALLQKVTNIPVLEISDDMEVAPNHIYIIPSNKMLIANDGLLQLSARPPKSGNELNMPIDLFFTSLAEVHQSDAIGVVLSGTASDGTRGLKAIKDNGGVTIAQDIASAAYDGMPNSAIQSGVVDFVLPPEEIPDKLLSIIDSITRKGMEVIDLSLTDEDVFKQILLLLNIRKGVDFTYYKQTTIRRRILRRILLSQHREPTAYLKYLRENKLEQDVLYQDLLIPVTGFFRDPQIFNNLCESIFPIIAKNKASNDSIRLWIAGCSTGEEAYSIAISFKEYFGRKHKKIQLFATDLSEVAIKKARTGVYSKNEVVGLTPQRLQEYFVKTNDSYHIIKQVRELCIFTRHDFLNDPPFVKMDFISCRNVLIYLEPYLQKKALTTFHYALNPKGYLLLGKSETGSSVPELFISAGNNEKLFLRKEVPSNFIPASSSRREQNMTDINTNFKAENTSADFQKKADDFILNKYGPAGVVVNEAMDIVHFRGATSAYLEQASGKPSHNLLKMAKSGLGFELRNLLHKAQKEKGPVIKENIPLQINESQRIISIEAFSLPNMIEPHYLILFHENAFHPVIRTTFKARTATKDLRIQQLEKELLQNREDMRSITEDQEGANEELQSANEELLSSSEELQSLNEELETSKEELQGTIEELTAVNQELISLNDLLKAEKDYSEAIVATIREPLLILDQTFRVKTANPSFYKVFQVNEKETERMLIFELGSRQWDIPALHKLLESILPMKETFFDFAVTFNFPSIGQRTMLLNGREITRVGDAEKLILLSFEDITERNRAELILKQSEEHFREIADLIPQKIWTADNEGNINYFNQNWLDFSGLSLNDLKDGGWKGIIHPDDLSGNLMRWHDSVKTGNAFEYEHRFLNSKGEYKWHLSRSRAIKDEDGSVKVWLGSSTEIQLQKEQNEELETIVMDRTFEIQQANDELQQANDELKKMNKELESFSYISSHDLQEPLRKIQTFISRILEKEIKNLSDNGKGYFERIKSAANRMQILINELISYSHATTPEQKSEKIDLNIVLNHALDQLKDNIQEKNAKVEVDELCEADIIPFQFQQLFYNLISNSLKFCSPEKPPHIIIKSEVLVGSKLKYEKLLTEKKYCHISIADNGIGFDADYNTKVFELFQRLHVRAEYPGTGIGLAIVKKIIDNHDGFITASGKLNKGVIFDIYIPIVMKKTP